MDNVYETILVAIRAAAQDLAYYRTNPDHAQMTEWQRGYLKGLLTALEPVLTHRGDDVRTMYAKAWAVADEGADPDTLIRLD